MENNLVQTLPQKYLKTIWALGRQCRLAEEQLRDVVEAESRQRSLRALKVGQALAVIDRLKKLSKVQDPGAPRSRRHEYPETRRPRRDRQVVALVSDEQRRMIDWLLRERLDLGGKDPNIYLATMCGRMFHRPFPRTAREAGLVIGNLRKEAERQVAAGRIPEFVEYGGDHVLR